MEPSYLGLSAIGWKLMLETWWEKLLASFLLATIVLGSLYLLYRCSLKVKQYWQRRNLSPALPASIHRFIQNLKNDSPRLSSLSASIKEPKSFGVYLGSLAGDLSSENTQLLSRWDITVLDPFQDGVLEVLSNAQSIPDHTLGRLDVRNFGGSSVTTSSDEVIQVIGRLARGLATKFKDPQSNNSAFTGVLLANFEGVFQPAVVNEIAGYINGIGLDVWLELSPPTYLTQDQCRQINIARIRGVVYRNATIRRDGDRQNYFQMTEMRTTMRAVAAQRARQPPLTAMWETVDDNADFEYAVVKRSFDWCSYNSALCWIGSQSATTDLKVAATRTILDKPLGAMMWLKQDDVTKAHDFWRANDQIAKTACAHNALYNSLDNFIPDLSTKLSLSPVDESSHVQTQLSLVSRLDRVKHTRKHRDVDPLSTSTDGNSFTGFGSFHLGLEVSYKDFATILHTQRNLKELNLLKRVEGAELLKIGEQMKGLLDAEESSDISFSLLDAVREFVDLLHATDVNGNACVQVFSGLHSGFQTSSKVQFWGVYDVDATTGALNIFISNKTPDRTATILHTFLSGRRYTRNECYLAELLMHEQNQTLSPRWSLPPGMVCDLEKLSPSETILFIRRLTASNCDDGLLEPKILAYCQFQVMDLPTLTQLRAFGSTGYLSGKVPAEDLVEKRLAWLREKGCWLPSEEAAIELFHEVDDSLYDVLMTGQNEVFAQLSVVMQALMKQDQIDAGTDIFALAVFCAFRRLALDEIYLEVMDRNPYPNHATDQAGCFAENFALGSRCDSFLDMTPRCVGRLISDRYRDYYMKYQPPDRLDGFTEVPTTYAAMQADIDPTDGKEVLPAYYKVTFLGIFAVPALIDIMLLTTIGRGLYLTTFMANVEKTMATTALMIALLTCGAVGAWISSGGSYYLYANAFPAMNMFILTRFTAGVAIVLMIGLPCMVGFIVTKGYAAGLIFFYYFAMLTIYLLTLAALAIYQVPGTSFLSGRTVIMGCIPILFISPVLTIWVQHDLIVYLSVLTVFLVALLAGARRTLSRWSTFYLDVPVVTDTEVIAWYERAQSAKKSTSKDAEEIEEFASGPLARNELYAAVTKECNRNFWSKPTRDPLVAKLAKGYPSTRFLMTWYCKFKRSNMPLAYSPTWNLTLKAGTEMMTNMQKGLKLHSAFLHWRNTGADVWSGLLYFIVALMDKWVALLSGGDLVGLSAASSASFRLSVGFGLCYYLIGAVSLDTVSQPLWEAANQKTIQPITSLEFLRKATMNDTRARRSLYWRSLAKFFFLHIWGAAITSALMWSFEGGREAVGMYLSYVGAYSGLLWYQYNKIYCGTAAAQSLAIASVIGIPVGVIIHKKMPFFAFSGVIALAVATWIAAFHSLWISRIGWSIFSKKRTSDDMSKTDDTDAENALDYYTGSALEPYPELSQKTWSKKYTNLCSLSEDEKFTLDPSKHPGARVMDLLLSRSKEKNNKILDSAFPDAEHYLQTAAAFWAEGKTMIDLISGCHVPQSEHQIRTVCRKSGDKLHLLVILGRDLLGAGWTIDTHRNCKIVAEALVQATCEFHLGLSHDHSMLAEMLVADTHDDIDLSLPEGVKRQLETSANDRVRTLENNEKILLRYYLLGLDCEREWDNLSKPVRSFLLGRSCGLSGPLSADEECWITSRILINKSADSAEYINRCRLGVEFTKSLAKLARLLEENGVSSSSGTETPNSTQEEPSASTPLFDTMQPDTKRNIFGSAISAFSRGLRTCVKFVVLSLTADPEYQRELDFTMHRYPKYLRIPVTMLLNGLWYFCKSLQAVILPVVLLYGRERVERLYKTMKHTKSTIKKDRIILESLSTPTTCFMKPQSNGDMQLYQYTGKHDSEPEDSKGLIAVNSYAKNFVLRRREERHGDAVVNLFTYEYAPMVKTSSSKLAKQFKIPLQRQCIQGELSGQIIRYDHRGYIETGSKFVDVNPVNFTYWYRKSAKFEDELLRGEFIFPHITIRVSWSVPPHNNPDKLDEWIPFTKVTEATFIEGPYIHHASWTYEHKFHPEISTTLNGTVVPTPPMISEDWFHVLKKPTKCAFVSDNPLFSFSPAKWSILSRLLGFNKMYQPISTSHARTVLWKMWKSSRDLDAITARWLDERVLRSDKILKPYWRNRDLGFLDLAKEYLDAQADTVMARTDLDPEISSWVHIAFKISDYYSFGQGGDSTLNTRTVNGQMKDSDEELHILAMDTSTWPQDPGGVSACRRDMVNDLTTIKWHVIAESANDYGVPRFQIERNVQSLTILPLWGLDFLNPTHGILENSLDSAVVQRSFDTRTEDIRKNFIPILTSLVKCSRTRQLTKFHLEEATSALVDLNTYFETTRNWNDVWSSEIVKQVWRELWLTEDIEDALTISQWWDFEKPTIQQLDQALNLWSRYLFIFSVPVPTKIPDVFQASHHFTGATYGILCKAKRGCTLHVWDHCISYREFTTFMASAVSYDMPFVNSSLISLSHLSCVLLEHHADVVLPCCGYFNPGWEVELGSGEGVIEHRSTFARKIDPVVNGICNMEKFEPIKTIKTSKPTVIMLSHVQFVKDIKNAIMATDLIVNKWGFTDYTLHIYGDMERAAGLSTECQELIAAKGLGEHCVLKGLGNASLVLQDAWLFLNSSISEGLPLAMGEAALTGCPVVCTDVGASFCVVTDQATGDRFSEVVSPNDCESLARAQISVLALLGNWSSFAQDAPGVNAPVLGYPHPSKEQVQAISERMYTKAEQRRALGMLGRQNVLKNFSADRYLLEHEQMLWIGKYRSNTYRARVGRPGSSDSSMWFAKEKTDIGNVVAAALRRNPRLPPESWVSLSSALTSSSTLQTSKTSSRLSLFTERKARPKMQNRWTTTSIISTPSQEERPKAQLRASRMIAFTEPSPFSTRPTSRDVQRNSDIEVGEDEENHGPTMRDRVTYALESMEGSHINLKVPEQVFLPQLEMDGTFMKMAVTNTVAVAEPENEGLYLESTVHSEMEVIPQQTGIAI